MGNNANLSGTPVAAAAKAQKAAEAHEDAVKHIAALVAAARKAQKVAERYTQEKVDELTTAIIWEMAANEAVVKELAEMAYEETKLGDVPSKITKVAVKCRGQLYDIRNVKTVGIVEEIPEKGLVRITKPVGVVGSLVPSTQPEMIPIMQAAFAVKARDAIIFAPHPTGKKTAVRTVQLMREVLKKYDAPADLISCIVEPTLPLTNELMKQVDLIIATGGQPMVRAAYSSGTPAFGVGAGNAVIIVDKSANLKDAAAKIKASKTFDQAAGCSCDNSVVIHEDVYDEMLKQFAAIGAYLLNAEEKEKLRQAIWPEWPKNHIINREVVARPAKTIADLAGIKIPEGTCILLVEETGSGEQYPFSGEKMCNAIAIYKFKTIDEAVAIVNANHAYSGAGHSCGIYSQTPENIDKVALNTYTVRVVVNQPQAATNTGNWVSGMPFTSTLGCGTWGGNICSENVVLKHYMNNTWVIREIPFHGPTDAELFAGFKPRK